MTVTWRRMALEKLLRAQEDSGLQLIDAEEIKQLRESGRLMTLKNQQRWTKRQVKQRSAALLMFKAHVMAGWVRTTRRPNRLRLAGH